MLHLPNTFAGFDKSWPYTRQALDELLGGKKVDGGGKAIGLTLCQELNKYFICDHFRLNIPEWAAISKEDLIKFAASRDSSLFGYMIRSSAADEDWLNGLSGCHKSFPILSAIDYACIPKGLILTDSLVKQAFKTGYGLVVDVAYSQLSGKSMVKIASGLERFIAEDINRPYFTSATADGEASVKVFEISSASLVCQSLNKSRNSAFNLVDDASWANFSQSLCKALKAVNIDFNVQLEFILDPINQEEIFLVQLRPSPAESYLQQRFSDISSDVYFESALFNRPGLSDFQSAAVIERLDYSRYLYADSTDNSIAILDPRKIKSYEMQSCMTTEAYAWLANCGYTTIITPFALDASCRHDRFDENHSKDFSEAVSKSCLTLNLPESDILNIIELTQSQNIKIAVQIDGMIGRVYIS